MNDQTPDPFFQDKDAGLPFPSRLPEAPDLTDLVLDRADAARRFQSARRRRWISTVRHSLLLLALTGLLGAALARRAAPGLTEFGAHPTPLTHAVSNLGTDTTNDLHQIQADLGRLAKRPIMLPGDRTRIARLPAPDRPTVGVRVRCENASIVSFLIKVPQDTSTASGREHDPAVGLVTYAARPTLDPRPRPARERRDESFRGVAP